ncbi:MAG: 50S ribosomal protein L21 [Pseudomonadota bacterium]
MYAVIKTGGKQLRVAPDDVVKVERLDGEPGDQIVFDDVLMVGDGDAVTVGEPSVGGATVVGEVVKQARSRKIIVFKKKRRQNYRRKAGHRQYQTSVKITDILTGGKSAPKKAAKAPAKEPVEEVVEAAVEAEDANVDAVTPLFTAPEGAADDLKKISGVGPVLEKKLNALGIMKFSQVAAFSPEDIERVDEVLNFKGRIERDNWLEQAAELAKESE